MHRVPCARPSGARREPGPRRAAGRPARRAIHLAAAAALAALAALSNGCGDGGADHIAPARAPAALAVSAAVHATTATAVEIRAGYLRANGERVELTAVTVPLEASASQQATFPVELARCLADGQRAVPGPVCEVVLELRLLRGATILDRRTVPVRVQPGDAVTVASPVALYEVADVRVVTPAGASSGAVAPAVRVEIADTVRLAATPVDASGAAVAERAVQWTSAAPAVARVDAATGLVTGVALGSTTVTAAGGGRTTAVPVTVTAVSVRTLTAAAPSLAIETGESRPLGVTARDVRGAALPGRAIAYASSDTSAATVSADGTVTGRGVGAATITATSAEGPNGTTVRLDVRVTVTLAAVASLTIASGPTQLAVGDTGTFVVVARDARGATLTGRPITFTSSDPAVATVSGAGTVTARGPGTATITVASAQGVGGSPLKVDVRITVTGTTGRIVGEVRNAVTQAPVAGVTVRLVGGGQTRTATTGASGSYDILGVAPGSYAIDAAAAGFQTQGATAIRVASVATGDVVRADFGLAPTSSSQPVASISGRVTTSAGAPIANAVVSLSGGAQTNGTFRSVTTRSDGTYGIPGIGLLAASGIPLQTLRLTVVAPPFGSAARDLAVPERNQLVPNVDFAVAPGSGPTTIYEDDFESAGGWTTTGFWNRSTLVGVTNRAYPTYVDLAPGDNSGGALPRPASGSYAYWYGQPSTGNFIGVQMPGDSPKSGGTSTGPNNGTLTSPAIAIPASATGATLRFDTWFEIESVNPNANGYDIMRIAVTDVATGQTTVLRRLNPFVDPPSQLESTPFTSGGFNAPPIWRLAEEVDLRAYRGKTVRVAFTFDTVDEEFNGFRGWIVDNVRVVNVAANAALAPALVPAPGTAEGRAPAALSRARRGVRP